MTRMDIKGHEGRSLKAYWSSGARTHLGLMSHGFPNLFFLNSVQSPSAFFSPPLLGDYQVRLILRIMDALATAGDTTVEPALESETAWRDHVNAVVNATLLPQANSWWMGANIPGKPRQVVAYAGGAEYERRAEIAVGDHLSEFVVGNPVNLAGGETAWPPGAER